MTSQSPGPPDTLSAGTTATDILQAITPAGIQIAPIALYERLQQLLESDPGQLGSVAEAMRMYPDAKQIDLLRHTTCANPGALSNRVAVVNAVLYDRLPKGASVARQAAPSVSSLLRRSTDAEVKAHLADVLGQLQERARDAGAVEAEVDQLESDSTVLEQTLQTASGVYVYTYPHYWRHPIVSGTERRLLKVGRTTNEAWSRVLTQARSTGMPEDPLLVRVYETDDPTRTERQFHTLLDAAEHERSVGTAVGREWFATTVEFCDAIAAALGLTMHRGSTDSIL